MDQAFQVLENHLLFRRAHFEWFDLSDEKLKRMKEFFSTGFMYPLQERDSEGRSIVIINQGRFDVDKFTSEDSFHLYFTILFTLLQKEESQIAGVSFIVGYDDITIKYVSMFSVTNYVNVVKFLKNACPCRTKAFYMINMPTFAAYLVNAAKAVMTEKLRNRLITVKSMSDITQFVDKSLLPKELGGGKFSEAEMMENFMKMFDENLPALRQSNEFDIDSAKLSISDEIQGSIGSFRKLEID